MPRVLREVLHHDVTPHTRDDWAVVALIGTAVAGLVSILALYPMRASPISSARQAEAVGLSAAKPEPVARANPPVRYEATIENWKRYRAANQPAE